LLPIVLLGYKYSEYTSNGLYYIVTDSLTLATWLNADSVDADHVTVNIGLVNSGYNDIDSLDAEHIVFNTTMVANGATIDANYYEGSAATNETRYFDFTVEDSTDPAGSAEISAGYFAYNKVDGSNGVYTVNGLEGVARSSYADEAGTFRGVYGRTYTSAGATATMRTAIGGEFSARAGYSGGTDCVVDGPPAGTAFVGARIWMAPYFTSGSLQYINNFWGLWIYGEHATQRNADAAIKIEDAGGGFTDDIIMQGGAALRNTGDDTLHITETAINLIGNVEISGITTLDSVVSIGGWGYTGEHIDIPEASSNTNAGLGLYSMVNYSVTAGKVFAGTYSRMLAMTTDQTNQASMYGTESQFRLYDVDIADGDHAGIWAYAEQSGTSVLSGNGTFSAISATVESGANFTVGATEHVTGITVDGSINGSASIDGSANYSAVYIKSNGKDWFNGIKITGADNAILFQNDATLDNSETDTLIATETVIKLAGEAIITGDLTSVGSVTSDGTITLNGTTGNGINATGTFSDHVIDIQPAATLGDNKAIYIGTWGTEAEFNDGGGLFRIYGKVGSGGVTSANIFVRTLTESTSPPISAQFYTDCDAVDSASAPNTMDGIDVFALINDNKYFAEPANDSLDMLQGMRAIWAKVGAGTGSHIYGNVATIWVDNQINCAVTGREYGIFSTTGGSKPDAWAGFETTSSGWSYLFEFDKTAYDKDPVGSGDVATSGSKDYYLKVNINGVAYGIQLYAL